MNVNWSIQDLEEKIEAATDELRREKRRSTSATLERERVEKVSAKLKDMTRQLEERLEKEERLSGKDAAATPDINKDDIAHVYW